MLLFRAEINSQSRELTTAHWTGVKQDLRKFIDKRVGDKVTLAGVLSKGGKITPLIYLIFYHSMLEYSKPHLIWK